ncbi:CoA transferase [Nocardia violaceofusca]|uniref:CoA transferase n=1 Tax=Nocardia violaceofusca TaxID=941182 RepID=UPI0007A39891|nr:CoA transferase [Nocardia violaceofusca]
MTNTSASTLAAELLPAGTVATVTGSGPTAAVVRDHLGALGATLAEGGPPGSPDIAAAVTVESAEGVRRELVVEWAGPVRVPGCVNETAVQAVCGVMHVNGRRYGSPQGIGLDYCSTAAGVLATTGLLASLLSPEPELTVRTSVAEAALLSVSQYLAAAGADDPEAVDLAPGGPPFTSADGVRFEIEALQPEPWAAFWTALQADPSAWRKGWRPFQFRYATATAPLPVELHRCTRTHTFAEIAARGAATGVAVCRLYSADESALSAGPRWAPWDVDTVAGAVTRDEHVGTAAEPLSGTVILEAGRRVQAPLAAHLLRLLGASVTRIEPPGGDPLRDMPPCSGEVSSRWLALNRHKDAVQIDIKSAADRAELRRLVAESDVFLHNWAPGKAEELELSAPHLPAGTVYTYTSGWSGVDLPDLPPGTDFMVQARTGLAELVGAPETPAAPSLMTLLDVLGGMLGAEATVLGLLGRRRAGTGVAVESSLLGAARTLRRFGRTAEAALRQPFRLDGRWLTATGPGTHTPVVTDLAELLTDPRFADVVVRDEFGCPALCPPWRLS